MSQQKNITSGTGLVNMVLSKFTDLLKWFFLTWIPKASAYLWDKSLSLSDFLLEAINSVRSNPIHHLWRKFWRVIFSAFIFVIILIILVLLINKFW